MDILTQLMAGSSLAAFAGLRAWLPLLALGLLAREGYAHINPEFQILTTTPVLIVLGLLTVLEFLGDKVIAVDHFLDAVGTLLRPISGAVLAFSWSALMSCPFEDVARSRLTNFGKPSGVGLSFL